jgi:mannose-6-phosphate isomerase-like protein (cupin superfamily)
LDQTHATVIDLDIEDRYQQILSGRPDASGRTPAPGGLPSCGMRSGRQALAPGTSCGEHSTGEHEEVIVVLSGRGIARSGDGLEQPFTVGQVLYVPPHTTHNMINAGDEVLRYVYVVAPAGL